MKTSTFYQDGVTEVGFTHPHITNKNLYRIYEIMVFEILDIKQCRTAILEKQETNKVNPVIAPAHCLE